ncbi:MAG: protein-L-isoaspartate O-methyltransferase family protein, partial [Pseudonocardiaceae bacterium]
ERRPYRSGRGRRKRTRTTGTSPAAYFTLRGDRRRNAAVLPATGYNTALLSHRLGDRDVYSVDIHPGLIKTAREHLAEIGCHPRLSTSDGADGWAEHAPFDRILATCAITQIPPRWIRQLADGGRIVAPFDAGDAGPLLVLDKTGPDEVTGRIDPYPA